MSITWISYMHSNINIWAVLDIVLSGELKGSLAKLHEPTKFYKIYIHNELEVLVMHIYGRREDAG